LARLLSIKDYPANTTAGMLDNLLRLPHELTLTESFAFVDRQIADERIGLALRCVPHPMKRRCGKACLARRTNDRRRCVWRALSDRMFALAYPRSMQRSPMRASLADIGAVAVRGPQSQRVLGAVPRQC
jgi:hypothetical protein